MKEIKIFLILAVLVGVVYFGVEPYAHSKMNEKVAHANFDFEQEDKSFAKDRLAKAEAELTKKKIAYESNKSDSNLEKDFNSAKEKVEYIKAEIKALDFMWANANVVMSKKGDAINGANMIDDLGCTGCHKVSVDDRIGEGPYGGYEVNPMTGFINPDLSLSGKIYDEKFLAALVLNPALAMKNNHKFNDENPHPMGGGLNADSKISDEDAQNIADLIAYLKEVAKKADIKHEEDAILLAKDKKILEQNKIDEYVKFYKSKQVFLNACARCHDMRYDGLDNNLVDKEAFKKYQGIQEKKCDNEEQEMIAGEGDPMLEYAKVLSFPKETPDDEEKGLLAYMGSMPPDLSMIIRARSNDYLNDFINNTQKIIFDTAMPRVGLNEQSQDDVMYYLEKVGDSKKAEREELGFKIIIYFVILAFVAWLWKTSIWRKLN